MRIYYEVTQWRSLASYTVEGNRLRLFNDPYCPYDVGEYAYSLGEEGLQLEAIDDICSFDLRSRTLSSQPWASCADLAADADPHVVRGCDLAAALGPTSAPPVASVDIRVLSGDSRKLSVPPELYADGNADNGRPVEGVVVASSPESIPYGRYRVLWARQDWLLANVDRPFTSMGVQFLGSYVIGWARILFDGEEVWRGDTSTLGEDKGIFGGYVEISGFAPGPHTIRVERLDLDTRPVVVLFFGFNPQGGVEE